MHLLPTEPDHVLMLALDYYWDAGIDRVSPGALGMKVRGKAFIRSELESFVSRHPMVVMWQAPDWIVQIRTGP